MGIAENVGHEQEHGHCAGAQAWRLAHGKDTEPVVARPVIASVQDGLRFDDPLGSVEAVMAAIDQLLAHTFAQPALLGRSVRQVRLRALLSDNTSWERLFTFKEALSTRDVAHEPTRRSTLGQYDEGWHHPARRSSAWRETR